MNRQLIILAVCALILIGLGVSYFSDRPPSPATLATQALSAKTPKERKDAVGELTMVTNRAQAVAALRRVVKESKDPEVLVTALNGLANQNDSESLPLFFTAMGNPDLSVRQAAYKHVLQSYGGNLPADLVYDPNGSPESRQMVVQGLLEYFKNPPPLK